MTVEHFQLLLKVYLVSDGKNYQVKILFKGDCIHMMCKGVQSFGGKKL